VLSPVWRAALCGSFGGEKRLEPALDLQAEDAALFSKLVALACGATLTIDGGLEEVVALGIMANRYLMESVQEVVEDFLISRLTMENCWWMLERSSGPGSGLVRLKCASQELALRRFDEFAETAGFMDVGEEVLGSLVDHDELRTEGEERVYAGVVRWMQEPMESAVRGAGLLRKVRFPYMNGDFLASLMAKASTELVGLDTLVLEARALQKQPRRTWRTLQLQHLDPKTLVARKGSGVWWEDYIEGGERKDDVVLLKARKTVCSVIANEKYMCGGLLDGSINVWSRSTFRKKSLPAGHKSAVWALVWCCGRLVSGSSDHEIRVWDVGSGRCEDCLEGHTGNVVALAASGGLLFSGSHDQTVRVWRKKEGARWRCERVLQQGESGVNCLAVWDGMVASGCADGAIRVWETGTWGLVQTLRATTSADKREVLSLVESGRRLIGSLEDGTLREWSMDSWACLRTVEACAGEVHERIDSLIVSGKTLVGGSDLDEVVVWDLETLEHLDTLSQSSCDLSESRMSLTSYDGEVWGAVGNKVHAWGVWR
jgi:hypothetical protein